MKRITKHKKNKTIYIPDVVLIMTNHREHLSLLRHTHGILNEGHDLNFIQRQLIAVPLNN